MATLQASRIRESLAKARGVGKVEEPLTLAGCEIVLQNLTPNEFESILEEISDLEDVEYAFGYQVNHVARSIVELNGMDLRDVDFVEEEVPAGDYLLQVAVPSESAAEKIVALLKESKVDLPVQILPPSDGATRTVQIERYQWIRDYVLSTWSREAHSVAWRKFMELLVKADAQVKEGIEFSIPDETAEEKMRRLLNEMRETASDLPDEMVDALLSENDLLRKSSQQELDQIANQFATIQPKEAAQEAPQGDPSPRASEAVASASERPPEAIQQRMAQRQPLSQQAMTAPTPVAPEGAQSAQRKVGVPAQIREAAYQNSAGVGRGEPATIQAPSAVVDGGTRPAGQVGGGLSTRSERAAQIAELEAQVDPSILEEAQMPAPPRSAEVAELSQPMAPMDSKAIAGIVDKPPVAGINRRFKPPRGR